MDTGSKVPDFLKLVAETPALKEAPVVSTFCPVEEPHKQRKNADRQLLPFVGFPFKEFPQSFRKMVIKMSAAFHIDPEFTALIMLTNMSAALGNSVKVSARPGYEVPPFLWAMVIARSGTGKSHPIRALMDPIKRRQAEEFFMHEESLSVGEDKVDAKEQAEPEVMHYWVSDFTIESLAQAFHTNGRGVLIYKDEIAGLVLAANKYRKGDDIQVLLSVFDGGALKVNRKKEENSFFVSNTGAAIIGGIQPGVLTKVFNEQTIEEGLLPRFLLLNLRENTMPFSTMGVSKDTKDSWASLINWSYSLTLNYDSEGFVLPQILSLDKAALNTWASFFDEMKELEPFLSEKATPFASKLSGYYSLKFAGLLHCLKAFCEEKPSDQIPSRIDQETVVASIKLTRFFLGQAVHALGLYGNAGQHYDEYERRLIETLDRVQDQVKNGRIPLSQVVEKFNATLPEKLRHSPEKVSQLLKRLRLSTERGTGGYANLTWEEEKIKQLIAEVCPYTVTPVTTGGSEGSDGSSNI